MNKKNPAIAGFFYFSNWDFSGNLSAINFALSRRMVSSVSRASFMQNVTSAKYMIFNVTGGIANILTGKTNILGESFAKDYFNQTAIKYKGFDRAIDRNNGNNRFKSESHCLLIHYDGIAKISRLNATVIDSKEDSNWFIGNILAGIDEEKISKWKERYGENAD